MLAAVLAKGRTVISGKRASYSRCGKLPNSMGADIKGAGTSLIKIDGVPKLHGGFIL